MRVVSEECQSSSSSTRCNVLSSASKSRQGQDNFSHHNSKSTTRKRLAPSEQQGTNFPKSSKKTRLDTDTSPASSDSSSSKGSTPPNSPPVSSSPLVKEQSTNAAAPLPISHKAIPFAGSPPLNSVQAAKQRINKALTPPSLASLSRLSLTPSQTAAVPAPHFSQDHHLGQDLHKEGPPRRLWPTNATIPTLHALSTRIVPRLYLLPLY
jgi:hypothetical protein